MGTKITNDRMKLVINMIAHRQTSEGTGSDVFIVAPRRKSEVVV